MATSETRGRPNLDTTTPDADAVFHVLSNRRRRLVVRVLQEADGPVDIGELARAVAAREQGVPPEEVTHRQRKSAYTALHQNHLPKLVDAGFVEVDREWVAIRLTDRARVLESHLDDADDPTDERDWTTLTACSVGLAAGFLAGVVLAAGVPLVGVAVGVLAATGLALTLVR